MAEAEQEAAVGNARPYTPPDAPPPPQPLAAAQPLPPTDGMPGEGRNAPPPGAPPKVDEKEHAYRAGARVAPAAPSRQEREWRGLPASQWEQRKGRLAGRHLRACELDSELKARKAAATRRASAAVLRSSVDAEAARARGDAIAVAAAEGRRDVEEERLYREMTSAYRAAAAAAPTRGGGGGLRGLHRSNPLALEREGLPSSNLPAGAQQDIAEAHPHFRQALRAHVRAPCFPLATHFPHTRLTHPLGLRRASSSNRTPQCGRRAASQTCGRRAASRQWRAQCPKCLARICCASAKQRWPEGPRTRGMLYAQPLVAHSQAGTEKRM